MQSLAQNDPQDKTQDSPQVPAGCMLGRELKDCPAKRAGCHNHLEMLRFMYPPLIVRSYILATMADNAEIRAWLQRIDAVLPGAIRPASSGREFWR